MIIEDICTVCSNHIRAVSISTSLNMYLHFVLEISKLFSSSPL